MTSFADRNDNREVIATTVPAHLGVNQIDYALVVPDVKPDTDRWGVVSSGSPSAGGDQMTACIGRRDFITLLTKSDFVFAQPRPIADLSASGYGGAILVMN